MEYRFLGSSGLRVSALSFGSWVTFSNQLDDDKALEVLKTVFDQGVNFFDHAEAYAAGDAELIFGRVMKKAGWRRSDLVLSTKIFWGGEGPNDRGLSYKHIVEGVDAALARLQTDYVDLVFCHRPDIHTPLEETVRAMSQVVTQGKAFYWGTSEWSAERIRAAHSIARREKLVPPSMEQPQYNMFHRDRVESEYARLYEEIGLGTTIWSPLASGILTGKYNDGIPDGSRMQLETYKFLREDLESPAGQEKIAKVRRLMLIAEKLECSMAQLALAWCLNNPRVSTVITGASRPEQVTENIEALEVSNRIDDAIRDEIDEILENRPAEESDFRGL